MFPVTESEPILGRSSSQIYDEREQKETDDCDDLDAGEDEFGFTVNSDRKEIKADHNDDDNGYPRGNIYVFCPVPVLYDDGSR